MAQQYKYIVTVGNYPHYLVSKRSNSLERAEKIMDKLSSEYKNQQVDLFEWDFVKNKWEHLNFGCTFSWAGSTITSEECS